MLFAIPFFPFNFTSCSVQRKNLHHVKLLFIHAYCQVQICGQSIVEFKFYEVHHRKCVFIFNITKNHPNCHLHQFDIFKQSLKKNGIRNHFSPHLIYNILDYSGWNAPWMFIFIIKKFVGQGMMDPTKVQPQF